MLDPDERLLVLRRIAHNGLIVGQTHEQVKQTISLQPTKHKAQELRIGEVCARALPYNNRLQ
jgi:hypothetical protein